jgi:hypothetical protein
MLPTTIDAVRAILKGDPSLTPAERARVLSIVREHGKAEPDPKPPASTGPRLVRRAEAAKLLGVSLRAIDHWARTGILHKVVLPGRTRAAGFRESDIVDLIRGRGVPV